MSTNEYHKISCNTIKYHVISSNTILIQCTFYGATSILDGVFNLQGVALHTILHGIVLSVNRVLAQQHVLRYLAGSRAALPEQCGLLVVLCICKPALTVHSATQHQCVTHPQGHHEPMQSKQLHAELD